MAQRFPHRGRLRYLRASLSILRLLARERPRAVVCEASLSLPFFWLLWLARRILGYRLIGWGHGISNQDWAHPGNRVHRTLQRMLCRRCDSMLLYSEERARQLTLELPGLPIHVAPNSLDVAELLAAAGECGKEVPDAGGRKELELAFIGRLIPSKRLDLALEALQGFSAAAWRFHIIGDGPARGSLQAQAAGDPRILFHGALHDQKRIGEILCQAHLLLHPGNLGLALQHAYAYACPVLSCPGGAAGIAHGPEAELLEDGSTGMLVPAQPERLREALEECARDLSRLGEMGVRARQRLQQKRGHQLMIRAFQQALAIQEGSLQGRVHEEC